MKFLSLGAGVQSTALLLMSCNGDFEKPDFAVFSDTGWEPEHVYAHLNVLKPIAESAGIPIHIVSAGNLRTDALTKDRFASMPLFTKNIETGVVSLLRRQCTAEYKLRPIQRLIRDMGAKASDPYETWIGISTDEAIRMRPPRVKYQEHRWPLIESNMDRNDCRKYLESVGFTNTPKSSCIGCPFHSDHYWNWLKTNYPMEFADAVDFDVKIRSMTRIRDEVYLHRSAVPLGEIQFDDDLGQLDLFGGWGNECEGMCGV